jgi:hypothetical protein
MIDMAAMFPVKHDPNGVRKRQKRNFGKVSTPKAHFSSPECHSINPPNAVVGNRFPSALGRPQTPLGQARRRKNGRTL